MSDVTLKFQCEVKDLVNAMGKYGGIQNVVIENNKDAEGIISCLLGIVGGSTYHPCNVGGIECTIDAIDGEIVFIKLEANLSYEQNKFIEGVKKLQELISSTKKGV